MRRLDRREEVRGLDRWLDRSEGVGSGAREEGEGRELDWGLEKEGGS